MKAFKPRTKIFGMDIISTKIWRSEPMVRVRSDVAYDSIDGFSCSSLALTNSWSRRVQGTQGRKLANNFLWSCHDPIEIDNPYNRIAVVNKNIVESEISVCEGEWTSIIGTVTAN